MVNVVFQSYSQARIWGLSMGQSRVFRKFPSGNGDYSLKKQLKTGLNQSYGFFLKFYMKPPKYSHSGISIHVYVYM